MQINFMRQRWALIRKKGDFYAAIGRARIHRAFLAEEIEQHPLIANTALEEVSPNGFRPLARQDNVRAPVSFGVGRI